MSEPRKAADAAGDYTPVSVSDFRRTCGELLNRVRYQAERILVRKRGDVYAYVVPAQDIARLQELEDLFDAAAAEAAVREKGEDVSAEALRRELGLA